MAETINNAIYNNSEGEAFVNMLFDYLENGYLENIITFFEYEPEQLKLIPKMISDERMRLKIGAFAILEELSMKNKDILKSIIPDLTELLKSQNRNIRGDAAYALEIIGDNSAIPALVEALSKEKDIQVREFIRDTIQSLVDKT